MKMGLPYTYIKYTTQNIPKTDSKNLGSLNIGAGENYLFVLYDYFNKISGYTFCDYNSYIDPLDNKKCIPCQKDTYSLEIPATKCYNLKESVSDELDPKRDFIKGMDETGPNVILIISLTVIAFGVFLISIFFILLIKKKCCKKRVTLRRRIEAEGGLNNSNATL
jgi:hypothetical protein